MVDSGACRQTLRPSLAMFLESPKSDETEDLTGIGSGGAFITVSDYGKFLSSAHHVAALGLLRRKKKN